jgi:hypothetical protein
MVKDRDCKRKNISAGAYVFKCLGIYVIVAGICVAGGSLWQSCKSHPEEVSDLDLGSLKQKYSDEVINYFYETAFYIDYVGSKESLTKWESDIWIRLQGELWPNDSLLVVKAIEQLNNLNLPIKLHITSDTALANHFVYFGDYKYLERQLGIKKYHLFFGIGILPDNSFTITTAKVGIANNAKGYSTLSTSDSMRTRESIILEEITQTLGITGDSWTDYNSIFFEGNDGTLRLTRLDTESIKLLYEPGIPIKYSRIQFEEDFQDVLYNIKPGKKIVAYAKENKIPIGHLQYIRDNSFNDSLIYKYAGPVFIKLQGDFQSQDLEFCRKAIEEFNSVSNALKLEIAPDDIWHELPSITIQYNDSTLRTPIAERFIKMGDMMYRRRVQGIIKISCKKSEEQRMKNKLLFTAMYKILGFDNSQDDIVEIDSINTIAFNSYYKETLSLLYAPVFPTGLSLTEMDEVVNAVK